MQALEIRSGTLTYRSDYPEPSPSASEVRVRVTLAGICSTDLELIKGYKGGFEGILGHEFVGIIDQAADQALIGRPVTASINIRPEQGCNCEIDCPEHCPNRTVIGIINRDGAFADYITLPLENVHFIPDSVPDEAAVFTEPLAAALRVREQIKVRPSSNTAVIGPGRLGMLVGGVLALDGTTTTMLGRSAGSLSLAQSWGLKTGLAAEQPAKHYDLVVEATGNAAGFEQALRIVKPRGTIVLKSTFADMSHIDLTPLVVNEISVVGSRCGPLDAALRLLAQNKINVQSLIDGRYQLKDAAAAFEHARQRGVRKILLSP